MVFSGIETTLCYMIEFENTMRRRACGDHGGSGKMKLGILVNEGPFTHQASDTAYRFTEAALAKGHEIPRVFFYHDGVNNANKLSEPQSDDRNLVKLWSELGEKHGLDLVVCVAAALRRGMTDELLAAGFRISGLGQLIETGIEADRLVVFGD